MKKNKVFTIVVIVLVLALVVSVWQNVSHANEQNNARRFLMNQVHSCFSNISINLDGLIKNIENNDYNDYTNCSTTVQIANSFIKADTLLTQYRGSNAASGLQYGAFTNFEFIANTLSGTGGTVNNIRFSSIVQDNTISEKEMQYLIFLRDDIADLCARMESEKSYPQENRHLTISQLNAMLIEFMEKWAPNNEHSPFFLLVSD